MRDRLSPAQQRKVRTLTPRLMQWFAGAARDLPWRRTRDPYAIWVSEIMLQQTQVKTVVPYFERWMKALPTIQSLARASPQRLHKLWEGLGYYRRVRNLQSAARLICHEHNGCFPDRFDAILALPGIGRYTAGAICSIAFNQPTPILDGNVIRVLTRVFGITSNPVEARTNARLWDLAEALVTHAARSTPHPAPCSALNQSLMELGATLCTPRNPNCGACPVRLSCLARQRALTDRIPRPAKRPQAVDVHQTLLIAEDAGRFWTVRRAHGARNSGLWEFPRLEEVAAVSRVPGSRRVRPCGVLQAFEHLGTFKHTITHHRITAEVYRNRNGGDGLERSEHGRWLTPAALRRAPLSALHRRIADVLLARPAS